MTIMVINWILLLGSLAVYAGYGLSGLAYLLLAVTVSYAAGRLTPKRPWFAPASVILNCAALLAFRFRLIYFFPAPLGISYFTLQIIAYNVDVWQGKCQPEKSFLRYLLCVAYLPRLFLGPIERQTQLSRALFEERRITWDGVSSGAVRALWGLAKKLIIASRAGVVVSAISDAPDTYRGSFALAAMLLYSVQIYADFSGGIDIVLGVSRMLGIRLSENFRTPYFSQTVQEFWRCWHITLGAWLRDYVYIPLGGNRKGKIRKTVNLVITFLVSGLWHGTSYLLWGLVHGLLAALGDRCKTKWKLFNQVLTFLVVSLTWSFFVWPDTGTAIRMLGSLFTTFNYAALVSGIGELGLVLGEWIVLIAGTAALWCCDIMGERISEFFSRLCPAGRVAAAGFLILTVLIFGMYGIGFDAEAFIYSKF